MSQDATKLAALKQAAMDGMASINAGHARAFDDPKALRRHMKNVAAKAISNAKRG